MGLTSYTRLDTTVVKDLDVDNTGEVVSSSADTILFAVKVDNSANSAISYFKIYDKASAATASDTPAYILPVPASSTFEFQPNMTVGRKFTSGISVRCVTEPGTAGTTNPTSDVTCTVLTS